MRKRLTLWILALVAALSLGTLAFTAGAAEADDTLYYYVNCGAVTTTAVETGLGLDKATLGFGDRAYADGFGYTTAGTVTEGDGISGSYRTGAAYSFDLAAGDYDLAVGTSGTASIVVGERTVEASNTGVTKIEVASTGTVTVSSDGAVTFIAVVSRGAKLLVNVGSDTAEAVKFGDVVESIATGYYSDGTTAPLAIDWKNLNAEELNSNFAMAEATGVVEGTKYEVSRKLFTMPEGLVYFVNSGSLTGQTDPATNDVYYDINEAILSGYEGLKNAVPDQEYSGDATWGYTPYSTAYPVSSKQLPAKAGDPYPPAFPYNAIRCTGSAPYSIEYTLGDLDGSYTLYVGTRSHWHGRTVTPYVNGEAKDKFIIDATNKITTYENVAAVDGKITLKIEGKSTDEGNVAFIAVRRSDSTDPAAPQRPTVAEALDMGTTEFTVGNVTAGDKVQVSLAESPYAVLYEAKATESGDYTVSMPAEKLEGIYRLRVALVNAGGAGPYAELLITDVKSLSVTPDITDFTTSDVTFAIAAASDSGIVRLEVTVNYYTTTIELDGAATYAGHYTVSENGSYEFKVYSGNETFRTVVKEVANIDRAAVSLSVDVAPSGQSSGKASVKLTYEGVADPASYAVYKDGAIVSSGDGLPETLALETGTYTVAVTSQSGKTAAQTIYVSSQPTFFSYETAEAGGGKTYTVAGKDDKTVASVYAYSVSEGVATRLTVTGNVVNLYEDADIAIKVLYTDGTAEFAWISAPVVKKSGCGSSVGAGSALTIAVLLLSCGAGVLLVRRRKA